VKTTDDQVLSEVEAEAAERPFRWARWLAISVLLVVLVAGVLGWVLRKSVAERALAGWCEARELVCTGKFVRLDSDEATLRALTVSGQGETAFEADEVRVALEWPRLFQPRLTGIAVDAPVAHGVLADGRLSFHGLERLARGGQAGTAPSPDLDIRDGRILIASSAGDLGATFSVSGPFPRSGHLVLTVDPARLDQPEGHVEWSEGVVDVSAEDGRLQGDISLVLEQAETDGVSVSDARLSATTDSASSLDAPVKLVWEGQVGAVRAAGYDLQDVAISGQAGLASLTGGSADAMIRALTALDMQVDSGTLAGQGLAASALQAEVALTGTDGQLDGPVSLLVTGASGPQGKAERLSAEGTASRAGDGTLGFNGTAGLEQVSLAQGFSDKLLKPITLPAPLSAHGDSLRRALQRGLAGFDTSVALDLQFGNGHIRLTSAAPVQVTAASGLTLGIKPFVGQDWLRLGSDGLALSGDMTLAGGGAPRATLSLDAFHQGADGLQLSARDVVIRPWEAGGARFGADLSALSAHSGKGDLAFEAQGRADLSGHVFGFDLADSHLTGGLQAERGDHGWQAVPVGTRCVRFDTKGVGIGAVTFAPNRLDLCPAGGNFVKAGLATPGGGLGLGDLSLPFTSNSVSGTLVLSDASIDWASKGGLEFVLRSPSLGLPMDIGSRTLTIDGAAPRVGFATVKSGSPRLTAELGATEFGGTLVPAKVSAAKISFDGTSGEGGLSGDIAGTGVLVRDFRDDPMYQPLLADLTATLDQGRLQAAGPFRLKSNDTPIGDFTLDANVLRLDGTARVTTRPLDFRKGGLQPVMLSERLRGVYTDAVGRIEAVSDVTITGGQLDGTAGITATGFGFQTTRLGRVQGVNGTVRFADLFDLRTEPSQVLQIGGLNPGVPLENGQITFSFQGGDGLTVDSASFPFSGGELALAPFHWTPGAPSQHIEVTAKAIDLAELVRTLKLPKIEAEGTVTGRFPIDFEGTKVLISDAHLFADPRGGRVAYLGDAADSAAKSDANVRMAFEALKDFDFTVLEVGLDGNVADRVTITLKLAGKSRKDVSYGSSAQIVRGQPFEFNIAIDSALAELFRSSQYYTNQQKLTDFVVKEVLSEKGIETKEPE